MVEKDAKQALKVITDEKDLLMLKVNEMIDNFCKKWGAIPSLTVINDKVELGLGLDINDMMERVGSVKPDTA